MIYIAIASIVALALVATAAMHTVGRMLREHARERNLMLNQLLHLAGRTWQPPPTAEPVDGFSDDDFDRYVNAPSQLLDDED